MGKYIDEQSTKQIGELLRQNRKAKGYSLDDIAAMTGFTINTISAIENGGDTTVSYIIAICRAIKTHPSQILNIELELTPLFDLPPGRKERAKTTYRVKELVEETDFFEEPRLVESVVEDFMAKYNVKPHPSEISTALKKFADEGKLTYTKQGRRNLYRKA